MAHRGDDSAGVRASDFGVQAGPHETRSRRRKPSGCSRVSGSRFGKLAETTVLLVPNLSSDDPVGDWVQSNGAAERARNAALMQRHIEKAAASGAGTDMTGGRAQLPYR